MDLSTISRILSSLVAPVLGWVKKPWAVRTAARNLAATTSSPIDGLDAGTFVLLGASSSTESGWQRILEAFAHRLVRTEPFSLLHAREWLNSTDTQRRLQSLSHARITSAVEPSDDRMALVVSYMQASGEHRHRAEDIVDHAVKVLVAGVLGAVKDDALGGVLQINMRALQQRFDEIHIQLDAQALPEPGWSLERACDVNAEWLLNAFSSRSKAKTRFGQSLSPADTAAPVKPMPRTDLTERFEALLIESPLGGVVVLTGDEGNGKSWLVAQAWLSLPVKPLTIFLTAEDIGEQIADPIALIARKLCVQTDRQGSERHQAFWSAQLDAWRTQRRGPAQGFLVVLDGLNQRPRTEWARLIDQLSEELEHIGGKLILTSRKRYFDGMVRPRLVSSCRELAVPEWTPAERDALLTARGMHGSQLHERVAASLCNPRLLGIALTLLDSARLLALEELSIPFLLFEHLRASQRDSYGQSAEHFKRNLQDHAKKILQRLNGQQRDDLKVFEGGLDAVVEGRFFIPLTEDLTRYTVREEGLGLALGLAILDELHTARRNGRDLNEALAALAEPIAALDQASEAIMAALTVACMSEENSTEIGVAILMGFAGLQNPDDDAFDAIAALARTRTLVFLEVARTLALQGGRAVNFDWIELALHQAKADKQAWLMIAQVVEGWLAHVTLDIEQHVFPFGRSADEVIQRRIELQGELEAKLARLSTEEHDILDALERTTAQDVSVLGKVALKLLAGMPLAQFARALVRWSFAGSLNGSYEAPLKEFRQLIRFNSVDWQATRAALLLASQTLCNGKPSRVGQWALVTLLQATGHPDDARHAQELVDVLRVGQPEHRRWRRVENYCSTDPCDPSNTEPDNVLRTAEQYAAIDVTRLYLHMGMDTLDYFFSDARPAVSRYYKDIAVERHRAWVNDVLLRRGLPLRQGVAGLLAHSALITHEQAQRFVCRVCGSEADIDALRSLGDEAKIWAQFQLQLAFPALDADAQLDALIQASFGNRLSQNLIKMIKPLDVQTFEYSLARAIAAQDDEAQFTVLLFTPFANCPLSPAVRAYLPSLLCSESTLVRAYTLRMVAQSGETEALRIVVQGNWSVTQLNTDEKLERWYGSEVMLEAAAQCIAPWESLVANMDYQHLGRLSRRLGGASARYVASVVDALLRRSLELPVEMSMFQIELMRHPDDGPQPQYFRLLECEQPTGSLDEALQSTFEQEDGFIERQRKLHAAFETLLANLTRIDADKLLDQFCMEDFAAIAAADTTLAEHWSVLLLDQPDGAHLVAVRNIGLLLAHTIAAHDPVCAVQLFEKFEPIAPLVRVVFGHTAIELGAMAVWSAADHAELGALRMRRLDCAANNDALSHEVWAALWNGKSTQLTQYIDTRLASVWPAAQARAVLVAGLMGQNPHSDSVLARFAGVPGLLGETQRVAREAYDRHAWTVHWLAVMRAAPSAEIFWHAAVLFLVVADGRVEALRLAQQEAQTFFHLHWSSIEQQLQNRFDKLRKKYKERLLAEEMPWSPFLTPAARD
ncbi:hypothetical protein PQU96_15845 [Vogesella sp. LYT5W]|uniref:NACHT domain-containing protein n=1 Tax=Vogesella margarita TaxID=2984199 RepID=A0ABT5ISW2_9NEIS|nr:hypothetical protein [Vogesella margarita]MDC7715588.1 hypothetical protein [Vogesella margarita]